MNRLCIALAGLALACGACGALKPGFTYHGNLRPTDQVLTNYEGFVGAAVTNVLESMDLAPTQVTNTEVVVSNVTVYTTEEHWVTNNVMDEFRTIVITNTVLTNVYHEVTNNVVNNFVRNFEHWHTNYTHEVTNVYHYETFETTNVVRELHVVTNNIYEVTNLVEHTDHYHATTNVFYDVFYVTNYVRDVVSNLHTHTYHDTYHTNYTTNVETQFVYEVTNLVEHTWHTNYTTNVESQFVYETTYCDTYHTNYTTNVETQYVDTVVSNFVEHTWHTNYEEYVIYERTNYVVNVTTEVSRVTYETNITTEVVALSNAVDEARLARDYARSYAQQSASSASSANAYRSAAESRAGAAASSASSAQSYYQQMLAIAGKMVTNVWEQVTEGFHVTLGSNVVNLTTGEGFAAYVPPATNTGFVASDLEYIPVDFVMQNELADAVRRFSVMTDPAVVTSVGEDGTVTLVLADGDRFTVPLQLTENGYEHSYSGQDNHRNTTFSYAGVHYGYSAHAGSASSSSDGGDTVQILYRNDEAYTANPVQGSNFWAFPYGVTFMRRNYGSRWRVYRVYRVDSGSYYADWWEPRSYSLDLNVVWRMSDSPGTHDSQSASYYTDATYTPTSASLYTGGTPTTVDFATQAELEAATGGVSSVVAELLVAVTNAVEERIRLLETGRPHPTVRGVLATTSYQSHQVINDDQGGGVVEHEENYGTAVDRVYRTEFEASFGASDRYGDCTAVSTSDTDARWLEVVRIGRYSDNVLYVYARERTPGSTSYSHVLGKFPLSSTSWSWSDGFTWSGTLCPVNDGTVTLTDADRGVSYSSEFEDAYNNTHYNWAASLTLDPVNADTFLGLAGLTAAATNLEARVAALEESGGGGSSAASTAWLGGTRAHLQVTAFRQSSALSTPAHMYAAALDSPASYDSPLYTVAKAKDVPYGASYGTCDISALGFVRAGTSASSYIRIALLFDRSTGAVATNWVSTGKTAAALFGSSSVTCNWTQAALYTSPTANTTKSAEGGSYGISGKLIVSPHGTY